MLNIVNNQESKNYNVYTYDNIIVDKKNILDMLINQIIDDNNPKKKNIIGGSTSKFIRNPRGQGMKNIEEEKEKPTKEWKNTKYLTCEHIIILDDQTHDLRDNAKIEKSLNRLFTTNRHIKSMVIVSTHKLKALTPVAR